MLRFTRFIRKVFAVKILLSGKFLLFLTLPPPHSNGHSVAPIFGQNHANARLYMDISPKYIYGKGLDPPPQTGNAQIEAV